MAEIADLARLRAWRTRPEPDLSIGGLVAARAREAKRTQERLGSLIDLWQKLVPADLVDHTRMTSLRGGVVHVVVDSSSTAYELDRRLREGLETRLRRAYRGTLARVRITVGAGVRRETGVRSQES